jgi:hypothetical protein
MREFRVIGGRSAATMVEADKFEVEPGGVLAFYKTPDGTTLGTIDEKRFRAFKDWNEVEEV